MSGAELETAATVQPADIITSLNRYVTVGGDINPTVFDQAIDRSEPPMSPDQLQEVIDLCVQGVGTRHTPRTPIDHSRHRRQAVEVNKTEANYAALLGATFVRLNTFEASSTPPA